MYPHERSLVKRLENKPFVLLGINSDPKAKLPAIIKRENMTWRSWWDGGSTGGPIASAWAVRGWPTLAIVDHQGIIQHIFVGSPGDVELDRAIDRLVVAAEKAAKPTAK